MDRTSGAQARFSTPLLLVCFFGSGLTGLAYELVWTRRLQLVFGSTTYSVSTVLAAFMAGLGFGSYLVGRWVDRHPEKGVRIYAWLELGVAGYALISLPLIGGVEALYALIQRSLELGQAGSTLLRFVLAFPVLALPAGMMGGTLPALVRGLTSERLLLPQRIGLLYGINTAGAACGTLLTGALAIELAGLWNTVLIAASLNFCIALVVFRHLGGKERPASDAVQGGSSPARLSSHLRKPEVLFATVAVILTGGLSMGYEIIWTRLLSLTMGSSTYAFTIVLGIFLLGIAGGSLLFSRFSRNRQPTSLGLAILLFLLAIWATVSLVAIPSLPLFLVEAVQGVELGFVRIIVYECLFAGAMLLIPTLILGAALPMAMGIISREVSQAGRDVGGIYLVNTCGAIAGSLLTGFLLVPWLGTHSTLLIILFANLTLAGGGLVLFARAWPRRLVGLAVSAALGVFIFLQPIWPAVVFDAGLGYRLDRVDGKNDRVAMLRKLHRTPNQLLFRREGINGTITVRHFGDGVSLLVNGKSDASNIDDMTAQVLTGVIPMAVHPKPARIGIVGWGSGVTAYSMGLFPDVTKIDAIEIERAVIEASPFFHTVNGAAERDPRVNVIYDDARSHFLTTEVKYDVITSEPSNPWMQGVSGLFSEDFYGLVNKRLAKGGIFAQWLQLYRIDLKSVAMVLRTLLASFPYAQLWYTDHADVMLLASQSPIVVDFSRLQRVYAGSSKLREYMVAYGPGPSPDQLLGCYLLDRASLEKIVGQISGQTVTDTNPRLEYRAVRNLYGTTKPHIRALWREKMLGNQVLPKTRGAKPSAELALSGALRLLRGDAAFAAEAAAWSARRFPQSTLLRLAFARALVRNKNHRKALQVLSAAQPPAIADDALRADLALVRARALGGVGKAREALAALHHMGAHRPTAQLYYQTQLATALGAYPLAWESAEKLMRQLDDPTDFDARLLRRSRIYSGLLTSLVKGSRDYPRGIRLVKGARARKEGEVQRLLLLLTLQRATGDFSGAAQALDALQAFNRIERPPRKICEAVYQKAGRASDKSRCASTL